MRAHPGQARLQATASGRIGSPAPLCRTERGHCSISHPCTVSAGKRHQNLRATVSEIRPQLEMIVQRQQIEKMLVEKTKLVAEKEAEIVALIDKAKKFEKERVLLQSAILACICVIIGMLIK